MPAEFFIVKLSVAMLQVGYDLKEEIERKFDKWQEPPPVKQVKPLPAPLDGQRKKRGGRRYASPTPHPPANREESFFKLCNVACASFRRYRKMKERLGLTEIRKHANRMTFAEVR